MLEKFDQPQQSVSLVFAVPWQDIKYFLLCQRILLHYSVLPEFVVAAAVGVAAIADGCYHCCCLLLPLSFSFSFSSSHHHQHSRCCQWFSILLLLLMMLLLLPALVEMNFIMARSVAFCFQVFLVYFSCIDIHICWQQLLQFCVNFCPYIKLNSSI